MNDNLCYQSRGSYFHLPRLLPSQTDPGISPGARAQSWLGAEAASLLPFPASKGRGAEGSKRSKTRGPEDGVREPGSRAPALRSREGFPGRSGAPAPEAVRRGLSGHRDWPRPASLAGREPGRRGGEEVVAAAALHQPCSVGGRMSPRAQSGSEGTGRALGSPRRSEDPRG